MAKYQYRRYLYGTHSRRNNCSEYQNGNCSMDVDACPGFESCSIYKKLKSKIHTDKSLNHELRNSQNRVISKPKKAKPITNCIVEIRPKREVIQGIVSKFNTNGFFNMNMIINTYHKNHELQNLSVSKVYIGVGVDRYICTIKNQKPFINSEQFITARFEFDSIQHTDDPIIKSVNLYSGMDDFYGPVYVKAGGKDKLNCAIELCSKRIVILDLIEKIDQSPLQLKIDASIVNQKTPLKDLEITNIFIGFDDYRYEFIFDKSHSIFNSTDQNFTIDVRIIGKKHIPGRKINTRSEITMFNEVYSQIRIRQYLPE